MFLLATVLLAVDQSSATFLFRFIFPHDIVPKSTKCNEDCIQKYGREFEYPCSVGCRYPESISASDDSDEECSEKCDDKFPIHMQALTCKFGCQYHENDKPSTAKPTIIEPKTNTDTEHDVDGHGSGSTSLSTSTDAVSHGNIGLKPGENVRGARESISTVFINGRGVNVKRVTLIVKNSDGAVREIVLPPKITPVATSDVSRRNPFVFPFISILPRNRDGGLMEPRLPPTDDEIFVHHHRNEPSLRVALAEHFGRWELPLIILLGVLFVLSIVSCCCLINPRAKRSRTLSANGLPLNLDGKHNVLCVSDLIGDQLPPKYTPVARTDSNELSDADHNVSDKAPLV